MFFNHAPTCPLAKTDRSNISHTWGIGTQYLCHPENSEPRKSDFGIVLRRSNYRSGSSSCRWPGSLFRRFAKCWCSVPGSMPSHVLSLIIVSYCIEPSSSLCWAQSFTGWGAYGVDILSGVDLTSDEMCQYVCQWIEDALVLAVFGLYCCQIFAWYAWCCRNKSQLLLQFLVVFFLLTACVKVWLGTPCDSWSTARRGKRTRQNPRGWPARVRSLGNHIWGLPTDNLTDRYWIFYSWPFWF